MGVSRTSLDVEGRDDRQEKSLKFGVNGWKKKKRQTSKDLRANLNWFGITVFYKYHKKNDLDQTQSFWENVLWTDETKTVLSGNSLCIKSKA